MANDINSVVTDIYGVKILKDLTAAVGCGQNISNWDSANTGEGVECKFWWNCRRPHRWNFRISSPKIHEILPQWYSDELAFYR